MEQVRKQRLISLFAMGVIIVLFLIIARAISFYTLSPFFKLSSLLLFFYVASRFCASLFYRSHKTKEVLDWPRVTFIIPCYNEEKIIEKTIHRCFERDYPKDKLEVVAVNDGSTDSSWEKMKNMTKIYSEFSPINLKKNMGKREAMAAAIRHASGDIVIQIDSDSYLEKNALKHLVSILEDRQIAGVSAHTDVENSDDNWLTKLQAAYYFIGFRFHKAAESSFGLVFCCSGCASAYRREYLLPLLDRWTNEVHFGVKTIYGDDRFLTELLLKEGYNTVYADKAQAYTVVPNTVTTFLRQQMRWKRSWIICTGTTSKYIFRRDPLVALTYHFPQLIIAYLTPVWTLYSLLYVPIIYKKIPVIYFLGFLCLYSLFILYYTAFRSDSYRPYAMLWGILNIFLGTTCFPYALLTIRDGRWGTR